MTTGVGDHLGLEIRRLRPSPRHVIQTPFGSPSQINIPSIILKSWSLFVKLLVVVKLERG